MADDEKIPQRYRVGDLIVDFGTRKVTRGGGSIDLTRKSFALLGALIRKSPQVLTHDELFEEAWGRIVVSDDALKQRIKVLRQSLDDPSDAPQYIESVRGVGYRLVAPVQVLEARDEPDVGTRPRARYAAVATIVVAILAVLAFFGRDDGGTDQQPAADLQGPVRLAVLPFRDLSEGHGNAWFAAGITEDIITQLSQVGDLLVLSSTTTSQYVGSTKSLRVIADELDVSLVLEGSVRLDGDRVRITGQLIDANSDTHLWAQDYDQDLEDIFAIQRDVASRIARTLRLELSASATDNSSEPPTDSIEAYEYFLRGRQAYARYTRRDNEAAIEHFSRALEVDPEFALAKAELANAYGLRETNFGFDAAAAAPAMDLALAALELDPEMPEAFKALGLAFAAQGRMTEARDAYLRAASLRPNYAAAVFNVAAANRTLGRIDEALEWAQRSVVLDPSSLGAAELYALCLLELGFMDEADRWFSAIAKREPLANRVQLYQMTMAVLNGDVDTAKLATDRLMTAAPGCGLCLSRAAIMTSLAGDDESAFDMFENLLEVSPTFAAYALLHMGRIRLEAASLAEDDELRVEAHTYLDRAEGILLQAIDSGNERFLLRWFLADVHAVRGEIDESLDWLDRAVEGGHHEFAWDLIEPALQNVRSHPRFTAQVEYMRQHVREMRNRARSEGWHTAEPPAFP